MKQASSAFNRQISESVHIQHNAGKHHILNSKSEYNRCALPRLTAKIGEVSLDSLEKEKLREKEEEKEMKVKIRELKIKNGNNRREILQQKQQPAPKKRKTDKNSYKRVIYREERGEKRQEEDKEEERMEGKLFPIFKRLKKRI